MSRKRSFYQRVVCRPLWFGALFSALAIFLVFSPALNYDFVDFDDLIYIINNRDIDTLDWQTVIRTFTDFHVHNWHPLTILSLALDRQLWGLAPWGFHLTGILIHSGTVFFAALLYFDLLRATFAGKNEKADVPAGLIIGGSIVAALFFGLHPLRVESVVWVSERKDVLCLFFITATLYWYVHYCRPNERDPKNTLRNNIILYVFAVAALLSKPTAITLPLLLLIIDWYPLQRITDRTTLITAIAEKIPLGVLAVGTAFMTLLAQREALTAATDLSLFSRILIAVKAIVYYLWQSIYPVDLSPMYPHPGEVHISAIGGYLFFLFVTTLISVVVILVRKEQQQWLALWFFFLIALAPTLGIIQVGGQWMANRYTYLPALGLSLLWGGVFVTLIKNYRSGQQWSSSFILIIIGGHLLFVVKTTQTLMPIWKNTETLATRVITLMPDQLGVVYLSRAQYRIRAGRYVEALADLDTCLVIAERKELKSKYAELHFLRAGLLRDLGQYNAAFMAAENAIRMSLDTPPPAYLKLRDELIENDANK